MAFDPDAYLSGSSSVGNSGFDPDAYLSGLPKGNSSGTPPSVAFEQDVKGPGLQDVTVPDAMTAYGLESLGKLAATGVSSGIKSLAESGPAFVRGVLNSPEELSPEYDALHEAAGISKNLPEVGGRIAKFPNLAGEPSLTPPPGMATISPKLYPRDPNALINFARSRIEGLGDQLSPQELNDYKTLLGQAIQSGKLGNGTPLAMASDLRNQASTLLNNRVEGLAELNKAYAWSKQLRDPTQFLPQSVQDLAQKYGPWILKVAAASGIWHEVNKR